MIRVGTDYYLVGSFIHLMPGLPLLHSKDLVNWETVTHIPITGSTVGYALKSTVLNLDPFIGKTVALTGNRVDGYPVDGGPIYIDVQTIK